MGPAVVREVAVPSQLNEALAASVRQALVPVHEIVRYDADAGFAWVQVRAWRLFQEGEAEVPIQPGNYLQAVMSVPDRSGKVLRSGARVVPWTMLRVEQQESPGTWRCRVVSAFARPLRTIRSRRLRQFGYRIEPQHAATTLRVSYRGEAARPRAGCQVFVQDWSEGATPEDIGQTDWQGRIRLPVVEDPTDDPGRILVLKYGSRLLAKVPLLLGYQDQVELSLPDDQLLVNLEGFVRSVEQDLLDLIARRQLLARRIGRSLQEKRLDDADRLLVELRALDNQSDFLRRLEAQQRRLQIPNSSMQTRVDQVFSETRQLLARLLSPTFIQEIEDQVDRAR